MAAIACRSSFKESPNISFSKKEKEYTRVSLTDDVARKALKQIQTPSGEGATSLVVTSLSVADASASFTRHVLQVLPSFGPAHAAVSGLGFFSAGVGVLMGSAVTVGNGIVDLTQAQKIGDDEGVARAGVRVLSGAVSANASALWLVKEVATIALSSVAIATDVLFGVGSLINLGIAAWTISSGIHFRSKINAILDKTGVPERLKLIQALEFLKEKIAPTAKEKEAIINEVEKLHPNWSTGEKRLEVEKKLLNLSEKKMGYIKRRTSQSTVIRLLKEIDQHLLRLSNPYCKDLQAASELMQEVRNQNLKLILFTAVLAVTSMLALTALVLGTFFSLGVLPYAILTLSSGIVLSILLYPMFIDHLSRTKVDALGSRAIAVAPVIVNTANPAASGN